MGRKFQCVGLGRASKTSEVAQKRTSETAGHGEGMPVEKVVSGATD